MTAGVSIMCGKAKAGFVSRLCVGAVWRVHTHPLSGALISESWAENCNSGHEPSGQDRTVRGSPEIQTCAESKEPGVEAFGQYWTESCVLALLPSVVVALDQSLGWWPLTFKLIYIKPKLKSSFLVTLAGAP